MKKVLVILLMFAMMTAFISASPPGTYNAGPSFEVQMIGVSAPAIVEPALILAPEDSMVLAVETNTILAENINQTMILFEPHTGSIGKTNYDFLQSVDSDLIKGGLSACFVLIC